MNMTGHDTNLAFIRGDHAGTVRSHQSGCRVFEHTFDPDHVQHRNAFGNTNHQRKACVDRFEDCVRRKGRRNIDDGCIGACDGYGFVDGVKNRQPEMHQPALARCHTADHVGAIADRLFTMECCLRTCKSLANDFCASVYQY